MSKARLGRDVPFFPAWYPEVTAEASQDPLKAATDLLVILVPSDHITGKDGKEGEGFLRCVRVLCGGGGGFTLKLVVILGCPQTSSLPRSVRKMT